jgi:hypothetical protein
LRVGETGQKRAYFDLLIVAISLALDQTGVAELYVQRGRPFESAAVRFEIRALAECFHGVGFAVLVGTSRPVRMYAISQSWVRSPEPASSPGKGLPRSSRTPCSEKLKPPGSYSTMAYERN